MGRSFSSATAEQVVAAVEAAHVYGRGVSVDFVADFADITPDQAKAALELAVDLGFLARVSSQYEPTSPLCRFLTGGDEAQKSAILRLQLESYEPFAIFRDRLLSTNPAAAAQQTKAVLDLEAHKENIKDTLLSLGTYTQALATEGGGRYIPLTAPLTHTMEALAAACEDAAAAEARVRQQLGADASQTVSHANVLLPLADALHRAGQGDGRGAVVTAGNAVESFLAEMAARAGIDTSSAHGLNAKLRKLEEAQVLPKKLLAMGRFLGNVRNAADHGIDDEIEASWTIRPATGIEFVFVACSFISNSTAHEQATAHEL